MISIQFDASVPQRMLRSPQGPVGRDIERRANLVAADARSRAPGSMGQYIPAPEMGTAGVEVSAVITCTHPAVHYVLKDTRPHSIRPIPPKRALRFTVGGRITFAKHVNHPGTKAQPFLQDALHQAV